MTSLPLDTAPAGTDTPTRPYDRVQRTFHWTMAALIIAAMAIGLVCAYQVPGTPLRRYLLEWHKSIGLTVLLLIGFRIAYRLATRAPPYAEPMGRLNHAAAQGAHLALYGLMLFMPLTGYALSAMGGNTLPFFWLFQWPRLLPIDHIADRVPEALHYDGAWVIYGVVGLHVAAVAWHRFVKRDSVLSRMWPRAR